MSNETASAGDPVIASDWLADQIWRDLASHTTDCMANLDRRHRGVHSVARDLFCVLFLAAPKPARSARSTPERAARIQRIEVLLDSAQLNALRSFTVGDEHQAMEWLPAVLSSYYASVARDAGTRVSDTGQPGDEAATNGGEAGDGVPDAFAFTSTSSKPSGTSSEANGTMDMSVLAGLVDATVTDLRALIDACHVGLLTNTDITRSGGRTARRPRATRDLSLVRTDAWNQLATPSTETLLWERWLRAGLPSRPASVQHRPAPLIVVVDESGSMDLLLDGRHSRRTWAKALVLSCVEIATGQRRDVVYVGYSSKDQLWSRQLPSAAGLGTGTGAVDPADLAEVCAHFFGGETDIATPVRHTMRCLDPDGATPGEGADVLLLSDGDCSLDDSGLVAAWHDALARTGSRCWGIRIGERDDPGSTSVLGDLCESVCDLEAFGSEALTAAFGALQQGLGRPSVGG